MFRLISATPSPYARKVRIALAEKHIPFELMTEVPWNSTTVAPKYNPLEKLPILILDDGSSVYESDFIIQYLELKFPQTPLMPRDVDGQIDARRFEVLCDGVCDAVVHTFFERMRPEDHVSKEWIARQRRKIDGGISDMARRIGNKPFAVGDSFTLGDIAVGTALGYLSVRYADYDWRKQYPNLVAFSARLEQRPSFAGTVPVPQKYQTKSSRNFGNGTLA